MFDTDGPRLAHGGPRPLAAILTAALALAACAQHRGDGVAASTNGEPRWFVAAANPYAVEAGAEILERGGSAVDAAIAVEAVLSLVEPQSSGFGGGGFMLHYDPAARMLDTYDGRETAPASATPNRFIAANGEPMDFHDAVAGGLSVGVPGVVKMLALAHDEHGTLAWSKLLGPAIALAEEGFIVSPRLNDLLSETPRLRATPAAAAYFYDEAGTPRAVGFRLKSPDYAEALRMLAEQGPDAFYRGPIAAAIVEAVNSAPNPGGMTLADIASYRAIKREPVCGSYRQYEICSMGPPSSGGVTLLQMLAMLERFDLSAPEPGARVLHLLFAATHLAYADRAEYLADPDQLPADAPPPEKLIAGLLNRSYLKARSALIDPDRVAAEVAAGDPWRFPIADGSAPGAWPDFGGDASPEPPSTTHFVIVDAKGRVVSMTATVESAFGSHQMAMGMILNNQLTDFSFLPVVDGKPVANAVGPGKRPRSSMTPVIAFDAEGEVWAALGSAGGAAIIGYVAKTLIAMIDWRMPPQEAVAYPNAVAPRGAPMLEQGGFEPAIVEALRRMGHPIQERDLTSGTQAMMATPGGGFEGGADPRREGAWKTGTLAAETAETER